MFFLYGQCCMRRKRAAEIGMFIEQHGLPKGVHFFKVLRPAILDPFVKYGSEQFIFSHPAIKIIDKNLYIFQGTDIFFCHS